MRVNKNELSQAKKKYKVEVKKMLQSYKDLEARCQSIQQELAELRDEVRVAGLSFGRTKVQTSGINKSTELNAMRKMTAESELIKKQFELEQKMKIIRDAVNHLDHDKAAVVRMKYIEGRSWINIEDELFISARNGQKRVTDSITPLAYMIFGDQALEESIVKIS